MPRVHSTSIVAPNAELASDVVIGPFCRIDGGVSIGAGTQLMSHVVVMGNTKIGAQNVFHPFTVIGGEAQVRKNLPGAFDERRGSRGALEIGDHNVFRESVTVNASSGEAVTSIGSHNLLMAGCHVAHDVAVGSRCVVANAVQLAGHVIVEDWVTFGGSAGVAQHLRVGQGAFVAAGAMCERDVPPFIIVQGDRARVRALNVVGLERRGVSADSIAALRKAFARIWGRSGTSFEEALRSVDRADPWVAILVDWLRDPSRNVKPASRLMQPRR